MTHPHTRSPALALMLVLFAMTAPVAHRPTPQPDSRPRAFVIDLDTSGGFFGRGRGGVTIDSDGQVRASAIGGGKRNASHCGAQLPAGDLRSLEHAVATAGSRPWPDTFAPAGDKGCCDRHKWTLRLEQTEAGGHVRKHATMWYDGNEDRLSKDIAAIRDIALRALTRAGADCGRK